MEKECVINPKTGRAVVVKGKIGRQVLKNQAAQPVKAKTAPKPKPKEPNTMYKKPIGPVKPKKVNTMYDKPIGPKVQDIPFILLKDPTYPYNKKEDFKGEIIDDPYWRKKLPTKEEIESFNSNKLTSTLKSLLQDISIIKLNKLDRYDEANFKALHPTIELLLNQMDKYKMSLKNYTNRYVYPEIENYYKRYMKLRKKITGQKIDEIKEYKEEANTMYSDPVGYIRREGKNNTIRYIRR